MTAEFEEKAYLVKPEDAPEEFLCPIDQTTMECPVVASDGHSYESKVIQTWFERPNSDRSPMTGEIFANKLLVPNLTLRSLIGNWKSSRAELDSLRREVEQHRQQAKEFQEIMKKEQELAVETAETHTAALQLNLQKHHDVEQALQKEILQLRSELKQLQGKMKQQDAVYKKFLEVLKSRN